MTKYHSTVDAGSRHGIHNLSYPDAADRVAGTNETNGIAMNPDLLYQVARQIDDDTLWMLLDDSPIVWREIITAQVDTVGNMDGILQNGGLGILAVSPLQLSDDAFFDILQDTSGIGMFFLNRADATGVTTESALVSWSSDGTVVLLANTTNVANSDSDGNFCFFQSGSSVRVKNRLGATRHLAFHFIHFVSSVA